MTSRSTCILNQKRHTGTSTYTYRFCSTRNFQNVYLKLSIMSSPGQRRGGCGHVMASFDQHSYCARCREKFKGGDPCVEKKDTSQCKFCLALTPEQLTQISTPSYKLKKEKREARKSESTTPSHEPSELVDPANVSVIGVVGQPSADKSPASSSMPPEKKSKKEKPPSKSKKSESDSKTKKVDPTDSKLAELDSKWSERFNRLEALLLSKTLQPTFSSDVRVSPPHSPPRDIPKDSEPFFQPTRCTGTDFSAEMHQSASQPESDAQSSSTERTGKGSSATQHQPASQLTSDRQQSSSSSSTKRTGKGSSVEIHQPASQLVTDRPSPVSPQRRSGADSSVSKQHPSSQPAKNRNRPAVSSSSATDPSHRRSSGKSTSTVVTDTGSPSLRQRQDSISSVSADAESDFSDRPPVDIYAEEGELSEDPDFTTLESEQGPSEDQTYRETMKGIRAYMGWSDIPDLDNTTTASDDNPFTGPKATIPGKVSVQMPTEDWLCKKIAKLNLTLVEGYPSRSSEAGGLLTDQFLKTAKSQSKWYGLSSDHKADPNAVSSWSVEASKLNSCYSRIARPAGLTSTPPASRRISHESLRRWEKSAREATVICNQAASFNRCLFKVQQDMQGQLKSLRSEWKGKGSSKATAALDELRYLMDFNSSITHAAAKTMEHLSDFVFISMGNLTLARRDAYLTHVKSGVKPDTVAALRTAPLHITTLFPDTVIKKAEEEISNFESRGHSASSRSKVRFQPYDKSDRRSDRRPEKKNDKPAWKNIGKGRYRKQRSKA